MCSGQFSSRPSLDLQPYPFILVHTLLLQNHLPTSSLPPPLLYSHTPPPPSASISLNLPLPFPSFPPPPALPYPPPPLSSVGSTDLSLSIFYSPLSTSGSNRRKKKKDKKQTRSSVAHLPIHLLACFSLYITFYLCSHPDLPHPPPTTHSALSSSSASYPSVPSFLRLH